MPLFSIKNFLSVVIACCFAMYVPKMCAIPTSYHPILPPMRMPKISMPEFPKIDLSTLLCGVGTFVAISVSAYALHRLSALEQACMADKAQLESHAKKIAKLKDKRKNMKESIINVDKKINENTEVLGRAFLELGKKFEDIKSAINQGAEWADANFQKCQDLSDSHANVINAGAEELSLHRFVLSHIVKELSECRQLLELLLRKPASTVRGEEIFEEKVVVPRFNTHNGKFPFPSIAERNLYEQVFQEYKDRLLRPETNRLYSYNAPNALVRYGEE